MIIWLRHGESTWNAAGRFQGRTPHPPLTKLGQRQAAEAAQALHGQGIAHIVSSPAVRARQTAMAVARELDLPVHLDPRLVEQAADESVESVIDRTRAVLAEQDTRITTLMVSHGDVIAYAVAGATGTDPRLPGNGEIQIIS